MDDEVVLTVASDDVKIEGTIRKRLVKFAFRI
jgi:uncharacterized protein YfeS